MGGRAVTAAVAVDVRIEVVAALERAVGIVHPLVQVAHHVEDAVLVGAPGAFTRAGERALELIEARVDHVARVAPHPSVLRLAVELRVQEAHAASPVVVAAADHARVAVRKDGRPGSHAGVSPLVGLAQALAAALAGLAGLHAAHVPLRIHAGQAHRANDDVARYDLVIGPRPLLAAREHLHERRFVDVDAERVADRDHALGAGRAVARTKRRREALAQALRLVDRLTRSHGDRAPALPAARLEARLRRGTA